VGFYRIIPGPPGGDGRWLRAYGTEFPDPAHWPPAISDRFLRIDLGQEFQWDGGPSWVLVDGAPGGLTVSEADGVPSVASVDALIFDQDDGFVLTDLGSGDARVDIVIPFSRGGTVLSPTGTVAVVVWRAPFACTVTAVKGYRTGGTGATINARARGTDTHLSSDLSLTSADTWMDGGAVQNTGYSAGDKMEILVQSVAGSPTQIAVQVDLTRP
jgi:hypothetical protein